MGLDTLAPTGLQEGSFQRALGAADAVAPEAAFRALCLSDGVIFYDRKTPDGAIEIVRGDEDLVRGRMDVAARHGWKPGQLLVPGVPEADDQQAGLVALQEWINWFANCDAKDPEVVDRLVWNRKLEDKA
ncbi:hypothetical protein PEC18_12165 [Paucibacter sp. O1-1]|nr:hypothetical protein [Paucibacter sp. O1-1]MDA3826571.1 hypothetical protein [Paucibacter sp. O1-1]